MGLSLRRLPADEAFRRTPELVDLAVRAKATWGYDAQFLTQFAAEEMGPFDDAASTVLVAEDAGALLGFAMLVDRGQDRPAWLEDLWIAPEHQRRGVGTVLLEGVRSLARERGAGALELEADPHAEPFYLRHGAARTGLRPSSLRAEAAIPLMRIPL